MSLLYFTGWQPAFGNMWYMTFFIAICVEKMATQVPERRWFNHRNTSLVSQVTSVLFVIWYKKFVFVKRCWAERPHTFSFLLKDWASVCLSGGHLKYLIGSIWRKWNPSVLSLEHLPHRGLTNDPFTKSGTNKTTPGGRRWSFLINSKISYTQLYLLGWAPQTENTAKVKLCFFAGSKHCHSCRRERTDSIFLDGPPFQLPS